MLLRVLTIISLFSVAHAYFRIYEPSDHCHNAPPTKAPATSPPVTSPSVTDPQNTNAPLTNSPTSTASSTAPTTSASATNAPLTTAPATNPPSSTTPTTSVPVTSTPTAPPTTPPSCNSCDVNRIAPTSLPAGTEFTFTDEISDGCKYSDVTCSRIDGLICRSITLQATYESVPGGPHTVDFKFRVGSASFKLSCAPDGNYASLAFQHGYPFNPYGNRPIVYVPPPDFIYEYYDEDYNDYYPTARLTKRPTGIISTTLLTGRPTTTAPVTTAPAACTSCNINAIAPTGLPAGTNFETTYLPPAEGCSQTQVSCTRTDDQYCTGVSITATTPSGDSTISSSTGTSVLSSSATLTCQIGETYSSGTAMQISQLTCVFTGCYPPSFLSCDVNRVAPISLPPGTEFTFTDLFANECKFSDVTCSRTNGMICDKIAVQVEDPTGLLEPFVCRRPSMNAGSVNMMISCADDGKYVGGFGDVYNQLFCQFTSCV